MLPLVLSNLPNQRSAHQRILVWPASPTHNTWQLGNLTNTRVAPGKNLQDTSAPPVWNRQPLLRKKQASDRMIGALHKSHTRYFCWATVVLLHLSQVFPFRVLVFGIQGMRAPPRRETGCPALSKPAGRCGVKLNSIH